MVGARPKPQDFTGRQREKLIKENAEELARRAQEMSIISEVEAEKVAKEVVDYTVSIEAPTVIDSVESVGVSLNDAWEVIQTIDDLEQVTIGVGNLYDFKAGRKYKVPKQVADHLREKGYVWG